MEKNVEQEDATTLLIEWLRTPDHGNYSRYGYDIYVPHLLRVYLERIENLRHKNIEPRVRELMPNFFAAGWELCRRGILRPGVNQYGAQATNDGNAGCGYSITPFGQLWLEEADRDDYIPTEPGRFSQMLAEYRGKFGDGFHERGQEAVRCYGSHSYLACCAMSGAAAESILLAAAIAKTNENDVLKQYKSGNGRRKVENIVIGKARIQLQNEYRGYVSLLKYWRDAAAHGHASGVSENEAYTAIALLLRFAMYTSDHWGELLD